MFCAHRGQSEPRLVSRHSRDSIRNGLAEPTRSLTVTRSQKNVRQWRLGRPPFTASLGESNDRAVWAHVKAAPEMLTNRYEAGAPAHMTYMRWRLSLRLLHQPRRCHGELLIQPFLSRIMLCRPPAIGRLPHALRLGRQIPPPGSTPPSKFAFMR
jgi:hypothetical protein